MNFVLYAACWSVACVSAAALVMRQPKEYTLLQPRYFAFLTVPWKLLTFLISGGGIVLIAPISGDPLWDYGVGALMSVLTFATAPWAVGALVGVARRRLPWRQGYVALCLGLLSSSWCYDLYNWVKFGFYPPSWFYNLVTSGALYLCAGLFWNLDSTGERGLRGLTFAFTRENWPTPGARSFWQLGWLPWLFMLLAAAVIVPFVWQGWD